jgi:hypothetical protein
VLCMVAVSEGGVLLHVRMHSLDTDTHAHIVLRLLYQDSK